MTINEPNVSPFKGKRRARKLALQALYQWLMSSTDLYEIELQFYVTNDMTKIDGEYFRHLLHGVARHLSSIEEHMRPLLDRPMQDLDPIELSVLRMSSFELLYCPEIPYRVVLEESVSLTKKFGSQDGYRFVNGVLNHLAKQVRTLEIQAEHG